MGLYCIFKCTNGHIFGPKDTLNDQIIILNALVLLRENLNTFFTEFVIEITQWIFFSNLPKTKIRSILSISEGKKTILSFLSCCFDDRNAI